MEAGGLCVLAQRALGKGSLRGGSLRDVDHQVIIPVQSIIPAACIAEHLLRDGAQDGGGGHLGRGQWGQCCPYPSPRTLAWEGQRPSHSTVGGAHRHLQQEETGRLCQGGTGTFRRLALPLKVALGDGEGDKGSLKRQWT